jgi:alpha-glucosidase
MRHLRVLLPALFAILLFSITNTPAAGDQASFASADNGVSLAWNGRELFRLTRVQALSFDRDVSVALAFFTFNKKNERAADLQFGPSPDGKSWPLLLDGKPAGTATFGVTPGGNLHGAIALDASVPADAVRLSFACAPDDRFWGFGEQYNFVDFRGRNLKIWTQEQGVGRAEIPPKFPPGMGSFTDTYFPMPYFMDPAAGKGFLLENPQASFFDLCKTEASHWTAEVWDTRTVSFAAFPGPAPKDIVTQLTAETGRLKTAPPDWAFSGVWLAAQGGTGAVHKRWREAMDAGIPVTAMWAQDWLGKRQFLPGIWGVKHRWVHDPELYPDLEKLIADMAAQGVRFLGYFNPYVLPEFEHWAPMAEKGWLAKTPAGDPYKFQIITFPGGLIDTTNPDAVEYFKGFARKAIAMGQKGWMCDYGEALPYDAVLANGRGQDFHNLYPTDWHRINREALEEAYPDGDFILLTRSGFTYEHKVAQVVWAADQEQEWEDRDGMPTVVRAALTIGLAGIPFYSHDVAGFSGGPSTKELFMRWTELGAFTPIFRTHDGLKKTENHRFNSDAETLAHFKKMALMHQALLPYFKPLAQEALRTGLPMIRHTILVDPEWPEALDADTQWMLGDDMLFAPVLEKGATEVRVKFPAGEWEHLLTGQPFPGRATAMVPAPMGTPAVFIRKGRAGDMAAEVRKIHGSK